MKLLLDEMYAPAIAEQLRARGHDVASVHDPAYRALEGQPDEEVWAAAVADDRVLVSENVQDFRHLEADALAHAQPRGPMIFTTDRQFPRGDPATIGRLVTALDALLAGEPDLVTTRFLKSALPASASCRMPRRARTNASSTPPRPSPDRADTSAVPANRAEQVP
jgi:predicted nuclease of predicted toxin-antitoxin system